MAVSRDRSLRIAGKALCAAALVLAAQARAQSADGIAEPGIDSAEPGLEEIVVTAQKREQRLQDVPVSVSALSADALAANRIMSVKDLDSVVPNLSVRTQVGGSSLPVYTMRGLVAVGSATGADKGVAIYIDGVYLGAATGSIFELAEIERIEVLRGPQGTLFGRNSTGGAISFITPEPTGEFGVKQLLTVGNYDQFRSVTRLNTPEFRGFSASFAYTHSERRGDIRNSGAGTTWDFTGANNGLPTTFTAAKHLGSSNIDAFAAQVKFEPGTGFKLIYRFDHTTTDSSANGLGVSYAQPSIRAVVAAQADPSANPLNVTRRPRQLNNDATIPGHTKAWGHSLTAQIELTDNISVKNITAYRKVTFRTPFVTIDGLGGLINTGAPIFAGLLGPAIAGSTIGAPFKVITGSAQGSDKQFSNEVQVNADLSVITLTAGALYYRQVPEKGNCCSVDGLGQIKTGALRVFPSHAVPYLGQPGSYGSLPTRIEVESLAGYVYGEFHLTPKLDVVAGLRYTKDKKSGIDNGLLDAAHPAAVFPVRYRDGRFTYNVGANYKITPDALIYGKYSTGYISGGQLAGVTFAAETAKSWEAGLKADWLDRTLRTNLSVFSVKYGNLQQSVSGLALTPSRPDISSALTNAGNARARGFELETTLVPVKAIQLDAGIGYTDFKFTKLAPGLTLGAADFLPQYRPKWTVNLAGQYESEPLFADVTMLARLDANWRSASFAIGAVPGSLNAAEQQAYRKGSEMPAHWLVNGRVALQGIEIGGSTATVSLWAKNLLNSRAINYSISLVLDVAADYERARTFGADLSITL